MYITSALEKRREEKGKRKQLSYHEEHATLNSPIL